MAGFDMRLSTDIDGRFLASIEANRGRYFSGNHRTLEADLGTVEPESLSVGKIDFVIGGPPCQSFSAAGRRAGGVAGIRDARGNLFTEYCRMLEFYRPRGFLFENVRGLLAANKGSDWKMIRSAFEQLGYTVSHRVVDAAQFGVPQHRERLIVVGVLGPEFLFPRPTHGPASATDTPFVSAGEAIGDLEELTPPAGPYGGKWGHLLDEIPPGQNYLYFTEEMGHPHPVFAWRSRFSDFLYKLDPSQPSRTIIASQGRYGGPFHWSNRKLTIAEHKRLQSFPDDYVLSGSDLLAIKQIGNSVAPRMARVLGQAVAHQIFGIDSGPMNYLQPDEVVNVDARKSQRARVTSARRQKATLESSPNLFSTPEVPPQFEVKHLKKFAYDFVSHQRIFRPEGEHPTFSATIHGIDGYWDVRLIQEGATLSASYDLEVTMKRTVQARVTSLRVMSSLASLEWVCAVWDLLHDIIGVETSFPSLQPLYGHFTEPYPKFDMRAQVASSEPEAKLAGLLRKFSTFDYCNQTHPLEELADVFPGSVPRDVGRILREWRWDIRTFETNQTIPRDEFRICYPFTLDSNTPRFVHWNPRVA